MQSLLHLVSPPMPSYLGCLSHNSRATGPSLQPRPPAPESSIFVASNAHPYQHILAAFRIRPGRLRGQLHAHPRLRHRSYHPTPAPSSPAASHAIATALASAHTAAPSEAPSPTVLKVPIRRSLKVDYLTEFLKAPEDAPTSLAADAEAFFDSADDKAEDPEPSSFRARTSKALPRPFRPNDPRPPRLRQQCFTQPHCQHLCSFSDPPSLNPPPSSPGSNTPAPQCARPFHLLPHRPT